jgi:hypothetical protein
MTMALATRVITWSVQGFDNASENGTITIQANTPELVDTTDGIVYVQDTNTYSVAAGQSSPLICTDNSNTNPSSGNWGYNITIALSPGIPSITVQDASLPSGGSPLALASILATAGL